MKTPKMFVCDDDQCQQTGHCDGVICRETGNMRFGGEFRQEEVEYATMHLIHAVEPNMHRGGLVETPQRVADAWLHWTSGYLIDADSLLKTFEDGAGDYDEMVMVKDIPFYSHCEHHLAPIIGRATVAYIPDGRIVGLSKLSRVVEVFARRLQVQERITSQVANSIYRVLKPRGAAVQIRARHLCMESRGVSQQGHTTTTQCLLGVFRDEPETRAEFIELAKSETPL